MVYTWGTSRRFNAYSEFFKKEFGERVQKLTINAGFTCPNRDGKVGRGGCTFCDNSAFTPSYNDPGKTVVQQLNEGITFHRTRYRRVSKYLAYFQAYSNTYAPLSELKKIYAPAIEHPDVVGIVIGTRPDCIDADKLAYFEELAKELYLVIEYGIESHKDSTLEMVNRGHSFEQTVWAVEETAKRNIRTGGHYIIGLPDEKKEDWIEAIQVLSELPLHSLKFHQLQVIRGTRMEKLYMEDPSRFPAYSMDDYLQLMCELVERLNPAILLERIAGEVNPKKAAKKGWGIRYDQVLKRFEEILEERNTWQGRIWDLNTNRTK
ncbi:TIGR01212 family radical SAM protein [Bacteroidota bacterium]